MRTTLILLIGLAIAGCDRPEPVATTEPSPNLQAKPKPAVSIPEATKVPPAKKKAIEFSKSLSELSQQANQLEAELKFGEAAKTWQQIDELVTRKFGEESWQAANAKLAGIMAA